MEKLWKYIDLFYSATDISLRLKYFYTIKYLLKKCSQLILLLYKLLERSSYIGRSKNK